MATPVSIRISATRTLPDGSALADTKTVVLSASIESRNGVVYSEQCLRDAAAKFAAEKPIHDKSGKIIGMLVGMKYLEQRNALEAKMLLAKTVSDLGMPNTEFFAVGVATVEQSGGFNVANELDVIGLIATPTSDSYKGMLSDRKINVKAGLAA